MSGPGDPSGPAQDAIARVTRAVALAGGALSLLLAGVVVVSVLLRWARLGSVNGDFELVQMGTAISVFCFLPLCQARRGNIMVDTFTAGLPARVNARIDAFWDAVYALTMLALALSLAAGARDAVRSGQNSMMLALPLWPAITLAAALTFLLVGVAIATGARRLKEPA